METATHERERELRRERVVAAMGARKKEGPVEEDERWLT
jgi:DNA invertase Pin-like site-specific DNA recombinase